MKFLIDIGHPAHVHLFKHFSWEMEKRGHSIFFTTREKECTIELLEHYGFHYYNFGKTYKNLVGKIFGIIHFSLLLLFYAIKNKPDIYLSHSAIYPSIVSWILRKPHFAIEDTGNMEQVRFAQKLKSIFLTSTSFKTKLSENQVYYKGYHELAYLHPNNFKADKNIKKELGLKDDEKYVLVRFVSWNASDDIGQKGFSVDFKEKFVNEILKHARVFISAEGKLEKSLKKYRLNIPAHKMHDVIASASLFVGEGATMAAESAVLGIPAIHVNTKRADYCKELEQQYNLLFIFKNNQGVIEKAMELLNTKDVKNIWKEKKEKMLSEKIDVTKFFCWFAENYPESLKIMKSNPEYQDRFLLS
ncbi:MAG: DUF354 domain-containing protein [Bacteroidota bacterium]|nr:DUF354 domain-containing protein [Bacteroidota bacterium]